MVLLNPQHIAKLPGHKTDVSDAEWIVGLLHHGLLRASFVPPVAVRDLRELTRYRKTLVTERAAEVNRLRKVIESANLKLASVATNALVQNQGTKFDLGGSPPDAVGVVSHATAAPGFGYCKQCPLKQH